ncbi:MAG: phage baseplate protein, partial [Leptospiraceae bacterium]|nr:phage baseplate protein [Leptospiraceae bacterium]
VKLLLIGSSYLPISNSNLEFLEDYFNGEEMNPGGSATVICENANLQPIHRSIVAYFADSESLMSEAELMQTVEEYFRTLGAGDDFKESDLRFMFYNLPRLVQVIISPSGDVSIPENTIAVPGVIDITAQVYS